MLRSTALPGLNKNRAMSVTFKSTGTGSPLFGRPDDYFVFEGDKNIGRILKTPGAVSPWAWGNRAMPSTEHDRGSCNTFEDAKVAFENRWEQMTEVQRASARDLGYWTKKRQK
jgi:hypothetical protein